MEHAGLHYVDIRELQHAVGARLSELMGSEAARLPSIAFAGRCIA